MVIGLQRGANGLHMACTGCPEKQAVMCLSVNVI